MAVTSMSGPHLAGPNMELDDYSLYSHLSDDELIQLAIERSIQSTQPHSTQAQPNPRPRPHSPPPRQAQPNPRPRPHSPPPRHLPVNPVPPHPLSAPPPFLRTSFKKYLTPLQSLISSGDAEALMPFVQENSSCLTEPSDEGCIALHEAAYYGQLQCLRILITEHGADPNIYNKERETALFKACERANEQIVAILLKHRALVNMSCSQGSTSLHEAARQGQVEICKMLLESGTNLGATNIYGIQPFFTAAQNGNVDIVNFLIIKGADINGRAGDGATPLYEASKNGHVTIVDILLSHKADANLATKSGLVPLHVAVQKAHTRIVSRLIPVTSKVIIQHSGISPLHIAADRNRDDIMELLIEAGFEVNAELSEDRSNMYKDRRSTVLYFSVVNSNIEAVEMLLEAGANPNLDWFNPLLVAVKQGCVDIAKLLLKYGANVNAQLSTQPSSFPSAILVSIGYLPMLKVLLDNGCNAQACFDCVYGNKLHPSFTPPQGHSEELRCNTDTPPQHCVQSLVKANILQLQHHKATDELQFSPRGTYTSSIMAAASVSFPNSPGPSLGFEDYSLYSNLSEEDLIQVAIERSLTDSHSSAPPVEATSSTLKPPTRRPHPPNVPANHYSSHNPPPSLTSPQHSSHNPPVDKPPDLKTFDGTVSHFMTGYGKRMVAYHRADGNLIHIAPEPEEEEEPLFKAIRKGDVSKVRTLANLPGTNLMLSRKPGWLALHQAAFYGQEACLRVLLAAQPGMINCRTGKDETALLLAVSKERVGCISQLLDRQADPDLLSKDRETPLYKACERENAEIVAMLLNHGAAVNTHCIQGWTALQEAVCRNNVEICDMLVKAGAKLSPSDIYGITPLFTAAQSGKLETLRFLIKHGADVNSQATDGATALYEATKNGHEDIVKLLLSQNADANKPGKTGLLPLHIAAQRGTDNIVSMLIPATSKARVRRTGISPLHLAAEHNMDEVLELLLSAGFDVNAQLSLERSKMYEDRRSTALYFAVVNNNIDAVTMLLEAGADPNLDIFNPLLVAVRLGCIQTVTLLVRHGANVNAYVPNHLTSFPVTVLFSMKYLPMLKYLLDNGCDALSCFNCIYGSNLHPPIKLSSSERDNLRYTERVLSEPAQNHCVQFCEMISTPSICRWAGPIIDVLLDYVGHVKLCCRLQEHLDSYPDWQGIKNKATPPRPLTQLCRLRIRQLVGLQRLRQLRILPLPGPLIRFLRHENGSVELC
ncbi:ankyrin repeat and SOCS box protein 2-like [Polymixia lowei]